MSEPKRGNDKMIKRFSLCLLFFMFAPLFLGFSFYFLNIFQQGHILGSSTAVLPSAKVYAALPGVSGVMAPMIRTENSTPVLIENYLRHYGSPLLPYKNKILEAAEKYGIQPQLIVAIAQQESNLGKKSPPGCFNAWGWGIHAKGTKCYRNWEEAIESVTAGIAQSYCAKGYCEDPCVMMQKYTPHSNGSWCFGINQFLSELETGDF